MKKNVGYRVHLVPVACRIGENGQELPREDDVWIIENVLADGVRISNTRTGHATTLGKDHVYNFTTNPDQSKDEVQRGFLTLRVQVFLQGDDLWIRPNARPGEPVNLPRVDVVEKWVDIRYPTDSGIQRKLEAEGYTVAWGRDSGLARKTELQDWEIVVELDANGAPTRFRLRTRPENQTLLKKRN